MVNNGPFLEWLRVGVVETAMNTFTEEEIATPNSKTENLAMLIHKIQFERDEDVVYSSTDGIRMHLSKETRGDISHYDDPRIIEIDGRFGHVTTSGGNSQDRVKEYNYNPPMLYSKISMWLGVKGYGQGVPHHGRARIGYTLEKVSKDAYVDALIQ